MYNKRIYTIHMITIEIYEISIVKLWRNNLYNGYT